MPKKKPQKFIVDDNDLVTIDCFIFNIMQEDPNNEKLQKEGRRVRSLIDSLDFYEET